MTGTDDSRLPVLIVAGFLGSGKTTLLRAALQRSDLKRTLVIVNEAAIVASVMSDANTNTLAMKRRDSMASLGSRGGRRMTSRSPGSR